MRRTWRGVLVLTLFAPLLACAGSQPEDAPRAALQRVLDQQATAVLDRDVEAYLRTVDPGSPSYRDDQRQVARNLSRLRFDQWSYRIVDAQPVASVGRSGQQATRRVAVRAELHYRLAGYDRMPVTAAESLNLVRRDGQWYVAATGGREDTWQLWEQGELAVESGRRSLVLGVGQAPEELRSLARTADRAVAAVSALWPHRWERRVVVQAPASLPQMAALLDAPVDFYRGIAAVTSGTDDRAPAAPADRIVVNPEAYGSLDAQARQVVLTHEATHVATRTHTAEATPLWLSEGFADWAGYQDTGRAADQVAPSLARAVRTGQLPRELPDATEFGFGESPDRLGRAYEGGWLACRLIARTWGAEKLVAFYTEVGRQAGGREAGPAVDRAMRRVLGVGLGEFTDRWRRYAAEEFGVPQAVGERQPTAQPSGRPG